MTKQDIGAIIFLTATISITVLATAMFLQDRRPADLIVINNPRQEWREGLMFTRHHGNMLRPTSTRFCTVKVTVDRRETPPFKVSKDTCFSIRH